MNWNNFRERLLFYLRDPRVPYWKKRETMRHYQSLDYEEFPLYAESHFAWFDQATADKITLGGKQLMNNFMPIVNQYVNAGKQDTDNEQ